MKRAMVLTILFGLLMGCTRDNMLMTATCVNDGSYWPFASAKYTMEAEGGAVKVIIFETVREYDDKEDFDATMRSHEEYVSYLNQFDGTVVSYIALNDTTIKETAMYDLRVLSTADIVSLRKIGMLHLEFETLFSVEKSINELEKSRFICTIE